MIQSREAVESLKRNLPISTRTRKAKILKKEKYRWLAFLRMLKNNFHASPKNKPLTNTTRSLTSFTREPASD